MRNEVGSAALARRFAKQAGIGAPGILGSRRWHFANVARNNDGLIWRRPVGGVAR